MPKSADTAALARLAARAERDPFFVASALAGYRELAALSHQQLAAWLGAVPAALSRLALCRRPNGDDAMFAEEVRRIAAYAGIDAGRLASLLRSVENAEHMGAGSAASLLAARDRQPNTTANPAASENPDQPEQR